MSTVKPFEAIPFIDFPPVQMSNPGPFLAAAYEQHGPIFRSTSYDHNVVYMVGPEANRFMLAEHRELFSHRQGWWFVEELFGDGLLTMDEPVHMQHRRMMNPAFTISYMSHYLPIMQRIIRERTATWGQQGEIDLYSEARKITFDVAAEALTGLRAGPEVDQFREIFVQLINLEFIASDQEDYQKRQELLQTRLRSMLLPKIEERRLSPTHDVLGMLVQARDEQGRSLSDEQLIAHTNILLVAGHETSTSLTTWLLYLLTQNPDYLQRVLAEQDALLKGDEEPDLETIKKMKVLENALSEAERLYPPVSHGPRGAFEDFEFNGYHVPAGTYVYYSIAASHLLPGIFANPAKFDPDRFAAPREEHKKTPYALVGFGGGPRICIGTNFAKVEIKALASQVLRRYRLELPEQEIVQFYRTTSFLPNGLKMRVNERQPALP
jgi:cytochrome P450